MTTNAPTKPRGSARPRFPWGVLPTASELDVMLGRTPPEAHRRRAGGMWEVFETRPAYSAADLYQVRSGVAVVRVYGLISGVWWADTPASALVQALDAAGADPAVTGVLLDIDSPGGEVNVMADLVAAVRRLPKPVAAIAHNMCASCAYWLASQADRVYTTRTAMTGCIGVYTKYVDDAAFLAEMGITEHVVGSTALKGITEPGQPFTEAVAAMLQHEIDEGFGLFVADVAAGRGVDEATVRRWADGSGTPTNFWHGATAVTLGLADEITDMATLLTGLAGGALPDSTRRASAHRHAAGPRGDAPRSSEDPRMSAPATTTKATPAALAAAAGTSAGTPAKGSMTLDELKQNDPEGYKAVMAEAANAIKAATDAEADPEKTDDMEGKAAGARPAAASGVASGAVPATLKELKALIPESTPDREKVILAALDAGDTPILAMGRANAALASRVASLEKAETQRPALKGVGTGASAATQAPAGGAGGGQAPGDFVAMAKARAAEKKISMGDALAQIDRENPGLRAAYVAACPRRRHEPAAA